MTQPAKGQEPSMEEILASIRRIIADEDSADSAYSAGEHLEAHPPRAAPARAAPPSPEPTAREEGFDSVLARLHASSRPASPASQEPEPVEQAAEPVEPVRDNDERPAIRRDAREQALISAATAAAVESALNTLAEAVQVRNGRTLEEVVTELLRPMLKSWLDDNLTGIVERLVRAEIERVTRNR
jgi:uncharacterized protein